MDEACPVSTADWFDRCTEARTLVNADDKMRELGFIGGDPCKTDDGSLQFLWLLSSNSSVVRWSNANPKLKHQYWQSNVVWAGRRSPNNDGDIL
jgi:hypothetical protein